MEKYLEKVSAIILLLAIIFPAGAFAYDIIEFVSLPATITTNISSFPITGGAISGSTGISVNGSSISSGGEFFSAIDLNAGENTVNLVSTNSDGNKMVYSRKITYDPNYSTADRELVYANVHYYDTDTKSMQGGTLIVDPKKNSFLGIIKGKYIYGITPSGDQVVFGDSRYYTANHSLNAKLPAYSGGRVLFNGTKAFYSNYRADLATNIAEANLPASITTPSVITNDGKTIFLTGGSIDTATNTSSGFTFSSRRVNWGSMAISSDRKYAMTSGFDWASGQCNLYDANTGALIATYGGDDYSGDMGFSPDNRTAYCTFWGNTYYGGGGIRIIDINHNVQNYYGMMGARSMVVSDKGNLFVSAFSGSNARGVAELLPTDNGINLQLSRVFFASLIESAYYGYENFFYKPGANIECTSNSNCGTDSYINNSYCSGSKVYKDYIAFSCNNVGSKQSACSRTITPTFREDCTGVTYDNWNANYCNASGNVEKSRVVHTKGCANGACIISDSTEKQAVQTCNYGCENSACVVPSCTKNSDCGTDGWVGETICSNDDVNQAYKTFTCNNPGTSKSYCSDQTIVKLKQDCGSTTYGSWTVSCEGNIVVKTRTANNKGCSAGACFANTTTEKVIDQNCQYACKSGACVFPSCKNDSDCGTNGFANTPYCYGAKVYDYYKAYKCNDPETANAKCTNSSASQIVQDCGTTTYEEWGVPYCSGNYVTKSRLVHYKTCTSKACNAYDQNENQSVEYCSYGCSNAKCNDPIDLSCPGVMPIDENYAFFWTNRIGGTQNMEFSDTYDFKKVRLKIKNTQNPLQLTKYFKKLTAMTKNNYVYARVSVGTTKMPSLSKVCTVELKQTLVTLYPKSSSIDSGTSFSWYADSMVKSVYLQFSYEDSFKHKKSITVTKSKTVSIAKYWKTLQSYAKKSANGHLYAHIYAIDKYGRKTYSSTEVFTLK